MINVHFFELTNFLMQFVVLHESDNAIYEKMAKLGIGPGLTYNPSQLTKSQQDVLLAGINAGHKRIVDGAAKAVNSLPYYGNREYMGTRYLDRAVGVEVGGIIPNTPTTTNGRYARNPVDPRERPITPTATQPNRGAACFGRLLVRLLRMHTYLSVFRVLLQWRY